MALGNDEGRFAYVNITKGKLAIKRDNEIVYFNYIEGYLTGLDIREDEYQGRKYQKLCLSIRDNPEDYQLQMRFDSGYARAFCNMVEHLDLKAKIKIKPTYEEKEGKGSSGMFINQNGVAIKWKYTKDHPHDLPLLEKVNYKGQDMWDNSKQQQFYYELLMHKIKPLLSGPYSLLNGPAHQLNEKPAGSRVPTADEITQPIDDLPF